MKPVLPPGSGWSNSLFRTGEALRVSVYYRVRTDHLQAGFYILCVLCLFLSISGCSLVGLGSSTPAPATQTLTPNPVLITATPPIVAQPSSNPATFVRIWFPPRFDPESGTQAAEILRSRLEVFAKLNPGVQIEVRVKAEDGPGSLLDSLETANVAAPLALPDLIVLSHPQLEIAAIKGYVKPLDSLARILDEPGWYPYAQQLGRLQDNTFGLPFAGEAQVVVFLGREIAQAPKTWEDVLKLNDVLGFPASDPQALFTLQQYQAAGGSVQDQQGRPTLDKNVLQDVLTFYQKAQNAGIFPYWLAQFETDALAWDAWKAGQFPLNVAWSTQFLQQPETSGLDAGLMPTRSGQPFTLTRGWVWAVASPNAERQELSLRLVEYLSDPEFIGKWTAAAGYIPPHQVSLDQWPEGTRRQFVDELANSAYLYPSENLLSTLGPVLRQAALAVLRQQVDPVQAASQAAELLK